MGELMFTKLSKQICWVIIKFPDKSVKVLKTTLNPDILSRYGVTAKPGYFYDLKYGEQLKEESNKQLETLKADALAQGVTNVEILVAEGSPKKILTSLPEVELIICGETGYNEIEKMMLGSVADRIVRYAPYDVLIVR